MGDPVLGGLQLASVIFGFVIIGLALVVIVVTTILLVVNAVRSRRRRGRR